MFVKTRFASYNATIRSVLGMWTPLMQVATKNEFPSLSSSDRDYLKDVCEILTPFESIIIESQAEKVVTLSSIIPMDKYLQKELEKRKDSISNLSEAYPMIALMEEDMKRGLLTYGTLTLRSTTVYSQRKAQQSLALILFKLSWQWQGRKLVEKLRNTPRDPGHLISIISLASCKDKENENLIRYCLAMLAVPATGSPVERVWSIAGLMTNGTRTRTEELLLNCKILVYYNCSLLFGTSVLFCFFLFSMK
uniref:HAT C-terminal dimerisation domain-containing protein n=1 Tax=Ditylenchus dipsaci TaxID=166011 RepID=A0A915DH50_9BILA